MISRKNYERERWEYFTGIKFEEVQHPISGFPPFKEFRFVPGKIDFGAYVRKALEKTNTEFQGAQV